jgi:hypothetical protein
MVEALLLIFVVFVVVGTIALAATWYVNIFINRRGK